MPRSTLAAVVLLSLTLAPIRGLTEEARIPTDADIITAIDRSSSVTSHDRVLQYAGLSKAVTDSRFLAQVASGAHRRIGFLAFTWSSDDKIEIIVPWVTISTAAEAEQAAAMLMAAAAGYPSQKYDVVKTDIALAIRAAVVLGRGSPYLSDHTFINICSNGISNSGKPPNSARDRAVLQGMTINAVLFGSTSMLTDYYKTNVVGGAGAFILPISRAAEMSELLAQKYWLDLTS